MENIDGELEFLIGLKGRLETDLRAVDNRLNLLLGSLATERQLTLVVDNEKNGGGPGPDRPA